MRHITADPPGAPSAIRRWGLNGSIACVLCASITADATGQAVQRLEPRIRPEVRVDYLSSPDAVQGGAGAAMRVGNYLRLAIVAGSGPDFGDVGGGVGWRVDLLGRFHVDPFRERRWAPYAAAGVSVRGADGELEEYLVALFGLEGPVMGSWTPALEIGLGGGARAGFVLRRAGGRYR